jgi:hypothetical protein
MHWLSIGFDRIVGFLPDLIAGLIILAVGYLIARVAARLIVPLAHRTGFDRLLSRHGLAERSSQHDAGSRALGTAAFWIIILATLVQTARSWRLYYVAGGLARILAYVPHLIAAVVIFGVALLVGDWTRDRIRAGSTTGTHVELSSGAVRAAILAFGAFMALRELLIAPAIVTIAFTLAFGAIALATALSFGLGSRRVAERVAEDWYERSDKARHVVEQRKESDLPGTPEDSFH